jgi:putative ABC transport system permease protein
LVNRLVFENLKHRPVRTLLGIISIGVEVTMMLTLVGLSHGITEDMALRNRGTGADIAVRPPNSNLFSLGGVGMSEKYIPIIRAQPHVALATGTLIQGVGGIFNSIAGIHLDEFNALSGGFRYFSGGPFKNPHELIVDQAEARAQHLHVGSIVKLGQNWRVVGIVEGGKLSRMFTDIETLQDEYSQTGKVNVVWVKVDSLENIKTVLDGLKENEKLDGFNVYTMQDMAAALTPDNVPLIQGFTNVVVGISVIVGFLVVFLSMYTAVLERTREIGVLKALGASPAYVLGILIRETVLLALAGSVAGILMSYGSRFLLTNFAPAFLTMEIVKSWWPTATAIALVGALVGALYPGFKAAKQDAIEALSYD